MRKRHQPDPFAPDDEKPAGAIPPREEKPPRGAKGGDEGKAAAAAFGSCPACGLKQGTGVTGTIGAECIRCGGEMNGEVSAEKQRARDAGETGAYSAEEIRRGVEKVAAAKAPRSPQDPPAAPEAPKPAPKAGDAPECEECGAPLTKTAVGVFHPCGHGGRQTGKAAGRADDGANDANHDVVTVTWGEEKFTPVPYSTFSIGPFTESVSPRPGESRAACRSRVYLELAIFAEDERAKKARSFLAAYTKTKNAADT